jgi:hypothetical protein
MFASGTQPRPLAFFEPANLLCPRSRLEQQFVKRPPKAPDRVYPLVKNQE